MQSSFPTIQAEYPGTGRVSKIRGPSAFVLTFEEEEQALDLVELLEAPSLETVQPDQFELPEA